MAVLVIVVAAGLRLRHLGYSEYQGDEARAMLLAEHLLDTRDPGLLLWHKKGPAEVVVPAMALAAGSPSENAARLPFALAGIAVVGMVLGLGWRLWGPVAGVSAGAIVALDGYLIAFSRIVQYQSLVLAASIAAVWLATVVAGRGRRESPGPSRGTPLMGRDSSLADAAGDAMAVLAPRHRDAAVAHRDLDRRDLALAALAGACVGFGTWAHYEAVFALPPVIWLLAGAAQGGPRRTWGTVVLVGTALAGAALVAGLFYVPFSLHPHFAETVRYIADSRVGGGLLYNNLWDGFTRASFYNASYVVIALAAALLGVLVIGLRTAGGRYGRVAAIGWVVLMAAYAILASLIALPVVGGQYPGAPGPVAKSFAAGPPLAVLVFTPVLAFLSLSKRLEVSWRAMMVWFGGPFVAAAFLVTKPHTHFYTMLPGAALLIGWGVSRLLPKLIARGRPVQWAARGALAALVGLALAHQWVVIVRHDPEYKRVYPAARLPGLWTPFGDEPPRGGYFGFPYRAGWRVIQAWYASGELSGSYDSNEEGLITGWYTWGAPRCAIEPRYYFVSWRPQDEEDIPQEPEELARLGYGLWGIVTVSGQEKLWVYERGTGDRVTVDGQVRRVAVEDLAPQAPPRGMPVTQALELPVSPVTPRTFGGLVRLIGAEATRTAKPGKSAGVTLAWESAAPASRDLSAFVHVRDPQGRTVAQSDQWPACGEATSTWAVGSVHFDAHELALPADLAPGRYEVWVGLYDSADGGRLQLTDLIIVQSDAPPPPIEPDAVRVATIDVAP